MKRKLSLIISSVTAIIICALSLCACADNRMPNGIIKNPDCIYVNESIASSRGPEFLSDRKEINSVMKYFTDLEYVENDEFFLSSDESSGYGFSQIWVYRRHEKVADIDIFESGRVQVVVFGEPEEGDTSDPVPSYYLTEKGVVDYDEILELVRKYQYR